MASSLSPRLENLLIAYQYWSDRYGSSSLTHDHKKKSEALQCFKEEAIKAGITEEELNKILEAPQQP